MCKALRCFPYLQGNALTVLENTAGLMKISILRDNVLCELLYRHHDFGDVGCFHIL
jgi:hypothetical protein